MCTHFPGTLGAVLADQLDVTEIEGSEVHNKLLEAWKNSYMKG